MAKKNDPKEDSIEALPKLKECFIITPIGELNSETFIKANGLINSVIKPVLSQFGFEAIAAHHINNSGSINNQIIKKILECELVIANLTGLNPNVMYELAIRHSARLPVVIMCEKGITPRLPFDITDQRTIFYDDSLAGSEIAKPILQSFIAAALEDTKIDNPIYAAATQENIFKQLDEGDPLIAILEKIESLGAKIQSIYSPKTENTIIQDKGTLFRMSSVGAYQTGSVSSESFKEIKDLIKAALEKSKSVILESRPTVIGSQIQFRVSYPDNTSLKLFVSQLISDKYSFSY